MPPRRPILLAELLDAAADRAPATAAVRCHDEHLTYEELQDRTARLAGVLTAHGIGRGDRVGIHLHKSVETFVAAHGVLRSGAAYVPIDPLAPAAAVSRVMADAELSAVIADDRTAQRIPTSADLAVGLVIGTDLAEVGRTVTWAEVAAADPAPIAAAVAEDPAYVMYTSGSTGRPKGIVHTHHSGRRYAELAADCYELRADDRMANVAPLHFDQSTFELFAGPLAGAEVVVVPETHVRLPAELAALVEAAGVSVWYSVPTILVHLLERGGIEDRDLSSLRWVLFGGEVFPPGVLRRWMTMVPDCRFSNVYGPAEVNQCMFHHLDEPPTNDAAVPIGKAWDDTELLVIDDTGAVIDGPDQPGELWVRTATMMQGYWRREELTFESIVGHPDHPGRWYRTGDLVRRRPDGDLEFLGRRDRQVKVRGNRVELESVESALGDVAGVVDAAVVMMDIGNDEAALVAAVTTSDDAFDERATVRALAGQLPPYAVPSRVIELPTLPMTGTGKTDSNAVAAMLQEKVQS